MASSSQRDLQCADIGIAAFAVTEDDYKKIRTSFDSMDADGSGSVDLSELFERLDEVQTPFTDAIFAMIDLDGNGSLDLEEYMRIICTYCMCTEEDVLR
eukprot:46506-Eustigmatos_ZCMA.PRE.1